MLDIFEGTADIANIIIILIEKIYIYINENKYLEKEFPDKSLKVVKRIVNEKFTKRSWKLNAKFNKCVNLKAGEPKIKKKYLVCFD